MKKSWIIIIFHWFISTSSLVLCSSLFIFCLEWMKMFNDNSVCCCLCKCWYKLCFAILANIVPLGKPNSSKWLFFCFRVQCNMESGSGLVFTFDYNQIDAGSNSNRRQCIFALRHSHHQTLILEKNTVRSNLCVSKGCRNLTKAFMPLFLWRLSTLFFMKKNILYCIATSYFY